MMDLKEIIKWFIPCFHILRKTDVSLTFLFMILYFNCCPSYAAKLNSDSIDELRKFSINYNNNAKNIDSFNDNHRKFIYNQSGIEFSGSDINEAKEKSLDTISEGRTFGPRIKKMIGAMLPVIFQLGAASTWAVVAAIVGVKTLFVSMMILKILLLAGAAKVGAFIATKSHSHSTGWESPQKQIHVHIHNDQHGLHETHEEHIGGNVVYGPPDHGTWSREGVTTLAGTETPIMNVVFNPIPNGPHTIRTPYGNYVKIGPNSIT